MMRYFLTKLLCACTLGLLFVTNTHAYSVFTLKNYDWSKVRSVDLFVAGYGKEMGLQFLYGAITRAQVHDDLYPDTRAQVILWAKEDSMRSDKRELENRGFIVDKTGMFGLSFNKIEDYLKKFPAISSFQIFSHNAAFDGNAIQSSGRRLNATNFNWKDVAHKFTDDSYVIFHGCNTGYLIAPQVSKVLGRPVLGSLSSTDFQEIFTNDQWYHNTKGLYPERMSKKKITTNLHSSSKSCWKGFCHRMMPNNHPYRGYWGRYEVGLPFYKSFCNYDTGSNLAKTSCYKGIAQALNTWPSLNAKSWQEKVEDFICPRYGDKDVYARCLSLVRGESEEKFFWGKTLDCTLKGCSFDVVKQRAEGGRVKAFVGQDAGFKPFTKEFDFLMQMRNYL